MIFYLQVPKWLMNVSPEQLFQKVSDSYWQKVIKQLVQSQQPSDKLIKLIKQLIDRSIKNEIDLQDLLNSVLEKSNCASENYKKAAIRTFILFRSISSERDILNKLKLNQALSIDLESNFYTLIFLDQAIINTFNRAIECIRKLNRSITLDHAARLITAIDRAIHLTNKLSQTPAFTLFFDIKITEKLIILKEELPGVEFWDSWWITTNANIWAEELINLIDVYRTSIYIHGNQLDNRQKQKLESYYSINKFLIDITKIEGAVSDNVKDEIEDSLILPWEELHRRYPHMYGEL